MPFPSDSKPDTEVFALIDAELQRQVTGLQLIAALTVRCGKLVAGSKECPD